MLYVYGLPARHEVPQSRDHVGRWLKPGDTDAIVIDDSFLKNDPDVAVGSDITLKIRDIDQEFDVVGIARGDFSTSTATWTARYLDNVLNAAGRSTRSMARTAQHDAAVPERRGAKRLATTSRRGRCTSPTR